MLAEPSSSSQVSWSSACHSNQGARLVYDQLANIFDERELDIYICAEADLSQHTSQVFELTTNICCLSQIPAITTARAHVR